MSEDRGTPVAIVTGAARGLGRATADLLASRGYRVLGVDLRPEVESLSQTPGNVFHVGDTSRAETARDAVALCLERFGRLDALVNNAGRFLRRATVETTEDEWDTLMNINARGTFLFCREALPALKVTRGAIVNVASISALTGLPGQVVYAATKGAIVAMTRQLAVEHSPDGVRVNAVAPGGIDTDFTEDFRTPGVAPGAASGSILDRYPLGRISQPSEVAEVIAFLCSPAASAMTGAIVSVDGGYTAM